MALPDKVLRFIRDSCTEKYPSLIQRHLVAKFGKDLPGGYISTDDVRVLMEKFAHEKGGKIIDTPAHFPDARHVVDKITKTRKPRGKKTQVNNI